MEGSWGFCCCLLCLDVKDPGAGKAWLGMLQLWQPTPCRLPSWPEKTPCPYITVPQQHVLRAWEWPAPVILTTHRQASWISHEGCKGKSMLIYILCVPQHRHITIGLLFLLVAFLSPSKARFLPPAHSPSEREHNSHTSLLTRVSAAGATSMCSLFWLLGLGSWFLSCLLR